MSPRRSRPVIPPVRASADARTGWRFGATVAVGVVLLAGCGGGEASEPSTGSVPDGEAAVVAPFDTVGSLSSDPLSVDPLSTDPLATDQVATTPPSTVTPAESLPVLAFTPQSAGPLEVTASQCTVDGIADGVSGAAIDSIAFDANRAYVPAEGGVAVLSFAPGPACSMVLDPTVGVGGLLATDDDVDSVSVSSSGRLVATGVFGSTVFDTTSGGSYTCDEATGTSDILPGGSGLVTWFPGSPVEQFDLTDVACGAAAPVAIPSELTDVVFVAAASSDAGDLFMGGESLDGSIVGVRSIDGMLQWRIGNVETGGPGWIGWVHGMAPCSGGYCLLDTNTDKLIVVDAVGALRAEFAVSALIGARMSYAALEPGPDGALYLLATDSAADGEGGTIDGVYVVRIEVAG